MRSIRMHQQKIRARDCSSTEREWMMGMSCSLDLFMEKWILNWINQWNGALLFAFCVYVFLIICSTVMEHWWMLCLNVMCLGHVVPWCIVTDGVYLFDNLLLWPCLCVFKCTKSVSVCVAVCVCVWMRDEAMRMYVFLITSYLLWFPPPAEDCQLLSQIPKVRCLRNGRREGECGGTAGDKLA